MSGPNSLSVFPPQPFCRAVRLFCAIATIALTFAGSALAEVRSVSWSDDTEPDGVASGTFAGANVSLTSTDGPFNGGSNLKHPAQWFGAGTNGVPGLTGMHQEAAAIGWHAGEAGSVNVDLGTNVEDPIFLFAFLDKTMSFDFDDSLSLSLVDQGHSLDIESATVAIDAGNVIRTSGHTNKSHDGFAVAVKGSVSSLQFKTNVDLADANSVAFSMVDCDQTLVGDFNCDAFVDFTDFAILSGNFGQQVNFAWEGDTDQNGSVDFSDFVALSDNFGSFEGAGSTSSAASVPEPAGAALLASACFGLFVGRRRRH